MAKVTRLEPKKQPQQAHQPSRSVNDENAGEAAAAEPQKVDIHAALLADIRTLLQECHRQLVLIRCSQPPPIDERLTRWEEWGKIMDGRGGIKPKPLPPIPAVKEPAPVIRIPPPEAPAPVPMIGEVDASFMTDRARERLEESL